MIRAVALAALLAWPAAAGTLEGRLVTFTVMTWDDPAHPFLQARGRTVEVGEGIEFGLEPEGLTGGLDVVPVTVEIGPQRVELTYPKGMGRFYAAGFNGYVLRFETDCALFAGWKVDRAFTTMPVTDTDIFTDKGALYINVSDRDYGPDARLAVDLDVTDCPLS
ncbi:hypothetical protein [Pseudogemmobacter blasticus]|uniref:Uncharacterized protein n=1 Tax=Fuscovulum blasticum DSM 2131 TaxID=1188250 RepID=A0A2T4JBH8_FUSBL|nr:hypothetical protein [Fuscovulum blasticum]PTE15254.1 hypothetical protein C5F44_05430 [Fuscovulum blasticum DSM 2131]